MKVNSKSIRNITISAITGGLIVGGASFTLSQKLKNKVPFKVDFIESYQVTTDKILLTGDGYKKLNPTHQYLSAEKLEDINELELKNYISSGENYDIEVYGFTNGSLTEEEKLQKQNQFENGRSLSVISDYNYSDKIENKNLPLNYENILEELEINTIDYENIIMTKESNESNFNDTITWLAATGMGTLTGIIYGKLCLTNEFDNKKNIKRK